MHFTNRHWLFTAITCVFVTCLLVGNIIGGKLTDVTLGGVTWTISVGEIPFPLTFVLTDLLNEFYGRKIARRVTLIGVAMTALTVVFIQVAALPHFAAVSPMTPTSYDNVFTSALSIQVASMAAFVTAQYVDIAVFFWVRHLTGERWLWLRATGSTAISQLIDTVVILGLAFGPLGVGLPAQTLGLMIVTSYIVKVTVAIVVTPLLYALHEVLARGFGLEPAARAEQ